MNKTVCNIALVYNRASRVQSIFCGVGLPIVLLLLFYPYTLMAQNQKTSFSVIPLGTKGGLDESNLSAYLVGTAGSSDYVCMDAGTLYRGATKAIQKGVFTGTASSVVRNIKAYLISHPHMDHVSGLIINSPEDAAKNIYALPFTLKTLQEKYFSWQSWANFGDAGEPPLLKKYHYVALPEGRDTLLQNTTMSVTAFPLSHSNPGESTAFLIRSDDHYLLYLGDTGPDAVEHSERLLHLWQKVAPLVKSRQLKAIMIEVSYPNEQPDQQLFGHLTPRWLMQEMSVLNGLTGEGALNGFPLVVTHSKSLGKDELMLRAQVEKENKFKFKLIFPEQGSLYRF
jgi:cAMP phosphodiesterase